MCCFLLLLLFVGRQTAPAPAQVSAAACSAGVAGAKSEVTEQCAREDLVQQETASGSVQRRTNTTKTGTRSTALRAALRISTANRTVAKLHMDIAPGVDQQEARRQEPGTVASGAAARRSVPVLAGGARGARGDRGRGARRRRGNTTGVRTGGSQPHSGGEEEIGEKEEGDKREGGSTVRGGSELVRGGRGKSIGRAHKSDGAGGRAEGKIGAVELRAEETRREAADREGLAAREDSFGGIHLLVLHAERADVISGLGLRVEG